MVIDEFQDTSAMQYVLLRTLASHQRITIVGDEDQVEIRTDSGQWVDPETPFDHNYYIFL